MLQATKNALGFAYNFVNPGTGIGFVKSLAAWFFEPLRTATAVWFSGGSQRRIADAYIGTPVEDELYKLVQRGGVIGGSSAGAAIQSRVMIKGGDIQPKISTGLDLLPGAIIDQHFLKRNRLNRSKLCELIPD